MDILITILIGAGKFVISVFLLFPFFRAILFEGFEDDFSGNNILSKLYFYYYPIGALIAILIVMFIWLFYLLGKA